MKKIFMGLIVAVLIIAILCTLVLLSPVIMVLGIVYLIFVFPKELRLEHERKLYRVKHGIPLKRRKNPVSKLLDRFQGFGSPS